VQAYRARQFAGRRFRRARARPDADPSGQHLIGGVLGGTLYRWLSTELRGLVTGDKAAA
jgi:hypothetical protein